MSDNNEDDRGDCVMSTKDQVEALLEENYNKYPDAIDWMMSVYARTQKLPQSKYEKFMEQLNGNAEFAGMHYNAQTHNIVELIKKYRAIHGTGLKQSKERMDWYIANNHYDELSTHRKQAYEHLRDDF